MVHELRKGINGLKYSDKVTNLIVKLVYDVRQVTHTPVLIVFNIEGVIKKHNNSCTEKR